jgi:type I restriction enzyme S subunit
MKEKIKNIINQVFEEKGIMGFALKFQVYVKMKEPRIKFRWETEFKETEIGEIPREWEVRRLGDVVYIKQGKNISTLKLKDWGYPVFGANGLIGYTDTYHYEEPQVLIACRGSTCGIINWSFPKSFVNNNAMALLPKSIDKKFLYFSMQLNFISGRIDETITGTSQPQITKETLEPFLIIFPPLPEQSRIATVLSWFDDLIEVKKKQNEILEKTAMAIFKSWFIDFEPFRDGEFVYSEELGKEIPKGWEVKKLGEVVRTFKGISYKSDEKYQEYIEGTYVFITLDNFVRGGRFKTEYSWIKSERIKPSHLVKESDLIIALTDMTQDAQVVGAPAIITLPEGFKVGVISLDCMKIDPIMEHLKYYLYIYLKNTQEENSTFANGANVLHLIINNFLSGKLILIPPPHILQSFHSLVEPLFQKIILNHKQIMTLRKIRDTLLPLLVFGKLRVEEV